MANKWFYELYDTYVCVCVRMYVCMYVKADRIMCRLSSSVAFIIHYAMARAL